MDFFDGLAAHGLLVRILLYFDFHDDPKLLEIGHPALDHAVKHDTHVILKRYRANPTNVVVLSGTLEERRAFQLKYFDLPQVWDGDYSFHDDHFHREWRSKSTGKLNAFIGHNFQKHLRGYALVAVLLPTKRKKLLMNYYKDYASHLYPTFEQFQTENEGKRFVLVTSHYMEICIQSYDLNLLRMMNGLPSLAYSS